MKVLSVNEQILLLSIWRMGDNAYGVTIRDKVMEVTGKNMIYGTLYNSLDQLLSKGYVTSKRGEPTPERGGRSKIFYHITRLGKQALNNSRQFNARLWQDVPQNAFEIESHE